MKKNTYWENKLNLIINEHHMENKYKAGDVVRERMRPNQRLVIKRFFNNLYYCITTENPNRKELVYLERDLKLDASENQVI